MGGASRGTGLWSGEGGLSGNERCKREWELLESDEVDTRESARTIDEGAKDVKKGWDATIAR